jgi:hypothetical protein
MSQLPASAVRTLRAQSTKSTLQRASAALGPQRSTSPVAASPTPAAQLPGPVVVPPPAPAPSAPAKTLDLDVIGPRKLIRPTLPESMLRDRRPQHSIEPALVSHGAPSHAPALQDSSHAEAFYFQKQVQSQTPMVFVLEDGDRVEGCIEWYDRKAIKVRSTAAPSLRASRPEQGTRILIYKSSIKYLYKAGENLSS